MPRGKRRTDPPPVPVERSPSTIGANDPPLTAPTNDPANRRLLVRATGIPKIRKIWFAEQFAVWADPAKAALHARVPYGTALEWIRDAQSPTPTDPEFAALFRDAEAHAASAVEEEIRRRGMEGVAEHVTSGGDLVWTAFRIQHAEACDRRAAGPDAPACSRLPTCVAAEPVPLVRDRQGAIIVTTQDGVVLEPGDYVVRPLTVRRYSDKLLLARARALLPDRYGWRGSDDRDDAPDRASFADLVRRVGSGKGSGSGGGLGRGTATISSGRRPRADHPARERSGG